LQQIIEEGVEAFSVYFPKKDAIGEIISQTLKKDAISKPVDALLEIYRKMRPGDPPTVPTAYAWLKECFSMRAALIFARRTSQIQHQNGQTGKRSDQRRAARREGFCRSRQLSFANEARQREFFQDDIDHLGNRRVRAVGECWKINSASVSKEWNAPSRKNVHSTGYVHDDAARFGQR
jgi:DNA-directed RNA polymerase subunit beta